MDDIKPIITTQSMLAIEVANQALSKRHDRDQVSVDFEQTTSKLRAHYAQERGFKPPDVTLDLLRERHARRRAETDR